MGGKHRRQQSAAKACQCSSSKAGLQISGGRNWYSYEGRKLWDLKQQQDMFYTECFRVFQTVFAVCVWAVSAAFLSQADELQPPREILKYSEPEHDPAQLADPPAVFMRENTPYYLASWELSEEELPGRMQYGESSVVYEKVGMNAEIPETAEISMEGENGLFTVPLVRSEYGNQRWEDDFSFTLTFHSCQADTYELGGIEISSDPDSDRPELQRYESELLEMLCLILNINQHLMK